MPGMNSGLSDTNATLVAAFRAALLHQGLLILAVLVVLALAWVSLREFVPGARSADKAAAVPPPEPVARRLARIGFGTLWIIDGLLQAQPAMAAGMPSGVIAPSASSSPSWVQHVVNWSGTSWSYHPVQAGAAAVWIQVGIGVWLIVAPPGRISRLAGAASTAWGLVVWVFGESFGGLFAPGLSFLFGAPGAVLFYAGAGALVALPDRIWRHPAFGRRVLAVLGVYYLAMAVLQAWPGRGFWQGTAHGKPGPLATMVQSMSVTSQPHWLAGWLSAFESFDAANGFAVNLFVVIALAAVGTALLTGHARIIRPALGVATVLGLATWVLIQDLGFLGGLGTDPNSMIPILLLLGVGYVALTAPAPAGAETTVAEATVAPSAEAAAAAPETAAAGGPASSRIGAWSFEALRPRHLTRAFTSASMSAVLAFWAAVVVIVGAAPMALAQANPNADPIIAQAIDGNAAPLDFTAPAFALTDQDGHQVSLASLRGKVVLLTFLDPVCTSDCPLIAQEFRQADGLLGSQTSAVEMVAIVANPIYRSITYTRAFDAEERMAGLRNWLFLTGSLSQLREVWGKYGIAAEVTPAGGMIAHNDVAFVIDARGQTRTELNFDPGPGTSSTTSSFAVELSNAAQQTLRSS
jgi:cytochrome oxidase Cu insertion factor (SCO1/SenC/PrrC family)